MVGDGHCDSKCMTENCSYDGGDCDDQEGSSTQGFCSPFCQDRFVGDRYCDDACYNEACNWDCGDCNEKYGEEKGVEPECVFEEPVSREKFWKDDDCAPGCPWERIGDSWCEIACYSETCNWDGGDCDEKYGVAGEGDISICAPGCQNSMIGDGNCDHTCLRSSNCQNDAGDCTDSFCDFECKDTMIGDGQCDQACRFSASCRYDDSDCDEECAYECRYGDIGDNSCKMLCYNAACNWDGGD